MVKNEVACGRSGRSFCVKVTSRCRFEECDDDAADLVTSITAMSYIHVAEDETEQTIELPCEEDDSLLLSTLTSHFPDASGLKFRNPESGGFRGIRLKGACKTLLSRYLTTHAVGNGLESRLQPPERGWGQSNVYFVVRPKGKRKSEDSEQTSPASKVKRPDQWRSQNKCSDLIVLGLAWKTTENELKEYFEQFGTVVMTQVKKDAKSGLSKGFGFVRFEALDVQRQVTTRRHNISGRWCDVRIPLSRGESPASAEFSRKIFVGRLTEDVTGDDLRDHFSQFGEVVDVFIPKPFRAFAFLTFSDSEVAQSLCGDDHILRTASGAALSVHVSNAVPKHEMSVSGFPAVVNGQSARRSASLTNHSSVHHHHRDAHRIANHSAFHPAEARHFHSPSLPPLYPFVQSAFPTNQNQVWSTAPRDGVSVNLNSLTAANTSAGVQNAGFPMNGLTLNPQTALHHLAAALVASPPSMGLFQQKAAVGSGTSGGPGGEEGLLGNGTDGGFGSAPAAD